MPSPVYSRNDERGNIHDTDNRWKKISAEIKDELKQEVAAMKAEGKEIALAVIQVGEDPASSVYVRNKKKHANILGLLLYPTRYRKIPPSRNCLIWWKSATKIQRSTEF